MNLSANDLCQCLSPVFDDHIRIVAERDFFRMKFADTANFRHLRHCDRRDELRGAISGFHFKADPYRRPQRGPVTDVNLPRGLRGRRVS